MRNIIERKRAEEELQESEAKFKRMIENVPDAIFVCRLGGEKEIKLPKNIPSFVIPLMWRDHKLYLVVSLE